MSRDGRYPPSRGRSPGTGRNVRDREYPPSRDAPYDSREHYRRYPEPRSR